MNTTTNPYLIFLGILISLFVIGGSVYYVNKVFIGDMQQSLTKVIVLIFTALTALWIVDKAVAVHMDLLTPDQSKELYELIKSLTLLAFGYYFRSQQEKQS